MTYTGRTSAGTPEHMKIRLQGAKSRPPIQMDSMHYFGARLFNEKMSPALAERYLKMIDPPLRAKVTIALEWLKAYVGGGVRRKGSVPEVISFCREDRRSVDDLIESTEAAEQFVEDLQERFPILPGRAEILHAYYQVTPTPLRQETVSTNASASNQDPVRALKDSGRYNRILDSGRLSHESVQHPDIVNFEAAVRTIAALGKSVSPKAIARVFELIDTDLLEHTAVVGFEILRGFAIDQLQKRGGEKLPGNFTDEEGLPRAFRTWIAHADSAEAMIQLSRETPSTEA